MRIFLVANRTLNGVLTDDDQGSTAGSITISKTPGINRFIITIPRRFSLPLPVSK